jgi:multidrug efflux pump
MASSVTSPLERQFGQMPGLTQMTSVSASGFSSITLQFALDLSVDVAEQEVQAAINTAYSLLPTDLPTPPVYSKINPADAPILSLALTSKSMPLTEVQDRADTRLAQKISQLSGGGLVSVTGGQRPAVRVDANPASLAAYNLTLEDVRAAIAAGQRQQGQGGFDGPHQASILGRQRSVARKQGLPVPGGRAYRQGRPVHLSDVAAVGTGPEDARQASLGRRQPAIILNIQRQPGANVIAVVDRVKAILPQLRASLPQAVDVSVPSTHRGPSAPPSRTCNSNCCWPVVLVSGSFSCSCATCRPRSSRAWRAPVPGRKRSGSCICSAIASTT